MRVAVLRCRNLPSFVTWEVPDAEALFTDDRMLIDAFARQGIAAESVVWTDPVDWDTFDVALIRSTWDYIDEREQFLQVLGAIERSSCLLFNTLDTVRWNSDKSYLLELAERGVSTIPTVRASHPDIGGWLEQFGAVGAVIKRPAAGDFRIQSIYGGTVEPVTPSAADLEQAVAIARTLPGDPLYARLDLVRFGGELAVMEFELIEPFLFFDHAPAAADRLASATAARAR